MSERREPSNVPIVFISSTAEDLGPYRAMARDAAVEAEFLPRMMEYFVASGEKPPLPACLEKVAGASVVVAIVAHRYGWVPPDQPPGRGDVAPLSRLLCPQEARWSGQGKGASREVVARLAGLAALLRHGGRRNPEGRPPCGTFGRRPAPPASTGDEATGHHSGPTTPPAFAAALVRYEAAACGRRSRR
jgi:hypothetical protein